MCDDQQLLRQYAQDGSEQAFGELVARYKRPISKGPLALGGHGCPVRFRDIWLRPL